MSPPTGLAAISPGLLRGGAGRNFPLTEGELVLDALCGLVNWPRRLRLWLRWLGFRFRWIWSDWNRIWLRFNRIGFWFRRIRLGRLRLRLWLRFWLWLRLSVVLSWFCRGLCDFRLSHKSSFRFFFLFFIFLEGKIVKDNIPVDLVDSATG